MHHPELLEAALKGYNIDTTDFTINTADNVRFREPNHDQWLKAFDIACLCKFWYSFMHLILKEIKLISRIGLQVEKEYKAKEIIYLITEKFHL